MDRTWQVTTARLLQNGCKLTVLQHGTCEGLKAGMHATTLGLAITMGLYNAAAWMTRRERHLAVNTILYAALIAWEREHVARHLASRREQCEKSLVSDRAA